MTLTNQYPSLKGKTVFVSGGGSGIGASLVESFCQQGAKVAFVDIQEDVSAALVDRLGGVPGNGEVRFYPCDLTDIERLQSLIALAASELGAISVLINNAANDTRHDFQNVSPEQWDKCLAVNLRHHFFAAQAVYPYMKELGAGSIINLGSMSWHAGQGGMPGYTSSKAAIEGLTRGLARDMGPDRIRVNCLVPGWVMTEKQLNERVDEVAREAIDKGQSVKDPLMPESISAMALFLASDDASMCTAQNFIVDGGWI
ncbi:SDR family NAD(P)-dependent oxidoreductase [Microbulbifer bruguierae]|uniref:SDR family NAD(P)-dependent oxidoreductase n=1 Tax=Microbulbifer bruguierae TaxID=3029061 RepID=A0ABY8NCC6_9GAMM|nr:SDR family oxidoreductase [Microbulbifer bruguierae]WGL16059.1 SDR family NAD(P)-dependent oxidoreductase [Microbulbifer bruguierae]